MKCNKSLALCLLMLFSQVDNAKYPEKIKSEAEKNEDIVCISALTGDGLDDFCYAVQEKLKVLLNDRL